jgi:hypothetical protein
MQADMLTVEERLLAVVALVMRGEALGRQLLGQVEHGRERAAVVLGEAGANGHRLDIEPFEEREVEVAPG